MQPPPPPPQSDLSGCQSARRTRERLCCRSAIGVRTPVTLDSSYQATPPARPAASGVPSKSSLRLSSDRPSGSRFLCHHLRPATTVLGEHSSLGGGSRAALGNEAARRRSSSGEHSARMTWERGEGADSAGGGGVAEAAVWRGARLCGTMPVGRGGGGGGGGLLRRAPPARSWARHDARDGPRGASGRAAHPRSQR